MACRQNSAVRDTIRAVLVIGLTLGALAAGLRLSPALSLCRGALPARAS